MIFKYYVSLFVIYDLNKLLLLIVILQASNYIDKLANMRNQKNYNNLLSFYLLKSLSYWKK